MKMFLSLPVAVVLAAMCSPAFAQSDKDANADKVPAKTYKRRLYNGKDAEKYRAMNDVQYFDGNRKNRPKGHHDEESHDAARGEERRFEQKQYRENGTDARAAAHEDEHMERAERREARPAPREEDNAAKADKREREERPVQEIQEENEQHSHSGESRRSYRREMRGSRKEMRRKSREDKWTGDGHMHEEK